MNVLVLNAGSSSIKFSVFAARNATAPPLLLDGELSGIGTGKASLSILEGHAPRRTSSVQGADDPTRAIGVVLDALQQADSIGIDAVGYRVVHPGPQITCHVLITDEILHKLDAAASFAPLHDPEAIAMIREARSRLPHVPHFACFDTIFHQTMPTEASTYPIARRYREQGVKRYGFHGLSCESILSQMQAAGPVPARMVIAHLGSGCSVTAVLEGRSIDTTMGLTPTGGVVMGTRPGDLDPGLVLYLLRQEGGPKAAAEVEKMLNHQAGMVALTELSNDMKAVRKAAAEGNEAARLALKVFTRSVQKAIGGFAWLMGGLDAIVFTGGIGEHDAATRDGVLAGTPVEIDADLNQTPGEGLRRISLPGAQTSVFSAPAQEDLVIALHVMRMLDQ